jgi:hypothetical protein
VRKIFVKCERCKGVDLRSRCPQAPTGGPRTNDGKDGIVGGSIVGNIKIYFILCALRYEVPTAHPQQLDTITTPAGVQ